MFCLVNLGLVTISKSYWKGVWFLDCGTFWCFWTLKPCPHLTDKCLLWQTLQGYSCIASWDPVSSYRGITFLVILHLTLHSTQQCLRLRPHTRTYFLSFTTSGQIMSQPLLIVYSLCLRTAGWWALIHFLLSIHLFLLIFLLLPLRFLSPCTSQPS